MWPIAWLSEGCPLCLPRGRSGRGHSRSKAAYRRRGLLGAEVAARAIRRGGPANNGSAADFRVRDHRVREGNLDRNPWGPRLLPRQAREPSQRAGGRPNLHAGRGCCSVCRPGGPDPAGEAGSGRIGKGKGQRSLGVTDAPRSIRRAWLSTDGSTGAAYMDEFADETQILSAIRERPQSMLSVDQPRHEPAFDRAGGDHRTLLDLARERLENMKERGKLRRWDDVVAVYEIAGPDGRQL